MAYEHLFHDRRKHPDPRTGEEYPFREEDEPPDWEKEPYLDDSGRYSG